jgi:hypothetical protein
MKSIDKNKEDMIFSFEKQEFPKSLIYPDTLYHKDLLFNESSEEPELLKTNHKHKYAKHYIIDDELERKKKHKTRPYTKESSWRSADNNIDFFDDFKGKTDEKQVKIFKLNQELHITKEYNYHVRDSLFEDFKKGMNLLKYYEPESKTTILTGDSLFENADLIMRKEEDLVFSPNPEIVNTKVLYNICEYLNYPKDDQLWYIFHPIAKSAFGPLSTVNIEEMYNTKVLNGQTEIRLIDCFNIRNKNPFTFFKMKEIEKLNFLETIEVTHIIKKTNLFRNGNEITDDNFFDKKDKTQSKKQKAKLVDLDVKLGFKT